MHGGIDEILWGLGQWGEDAQAKEVRMHNVEPAAWEDEKVVGF